MSLITSSTVKPSKPTSKSDKVKKSELNKDAKAAPLFSKKNAGPNSKAIKNDWLTSIHAVHQQLQNIHQELNEISKEINAILLDMKKLKQPDLKNNPDGDSSASESDGSSYDSSDDSSEDERIRSSDSDENDSHGASKNNTNLHQIHQNMVENYLEELNKNLEIDAEFSKSMEEKLNNQIKNNTKNVKQNLSQLNEDVISGLPVELYERIKKLKERVINIYQ